MRFFSGLGLLAVPAAQLRPPGVRSHVLTVSTATTQKNPCWVSATPADTQMKLGSAIARRWTPTDAPCRSDCATVAVIMAPTTVRTAKLAPRTAEIARSGTGKGHRASSGAGPPRATKPAAKTSRCRLCQ